LRKKVFVDNWQPLETRTLRDNVVSLLRQAIVEGTLPAGAELNQAHVAERLGISRGPLREALGQLEQEGLILSIPYKGSIVTSLTPDYVDELYSLRSALEGFALEQIFLDKTRTKQVAQQLEQVVSDMRQAAMAKDNRWLVELDLNFHRIIIDMSDHELLARTWTPLEMGVKRCLYTRHKIYRSLEEVVGNHPDLIAAISEARAEDAKQLLHDHIMEAGNLIQQGWIDGEPAQVSSEGVLESLQVHLSEQLAGASSSAKAGKRGND
jgi:DNA-binding GntR family transcriptional regulator